MNQLQPKYRRILLKLSGEALAKGGSGIINESFVKEIADVLKRCLREGVEIGIIVGAGNIWRGRQGVDMDPTRADSMGMLATAINAIALEVQLYLSIRIITYFCLYSLLKLLTSHCVKICQLLIYAIFSPVATLRHQVLKSGN